MTRQAFAAGALALAATQAGAQSLPPGFYIEGRAQADYLFNASPSRDFLSADLSLGIRGEESPFALPIGFDIGLKGFNSNKGDLSESVLYGAVTWATEMGTFSAGAPRPATSSHFPMPRIGGSTAFAAFAGTGVTTTDTIALFDKSNTIGFRYDYAVDDVTVGFSYHDFTDSSTATWTGVVAWESGPLALALGVEHADGGGRGGTDFSARAAYDTEFWGVAGLYSSTAGIDTRTVALDAYYALREDIRFTAAWARFDVEERDSTVYGVGAEYVFPTGVYAGIGITDSDVLDLDAGYTAYLGWAFDY